MLRQLTFWKYETKLIYKLVLSEELGEVSVLLMQVDNRVNGKRSYLASLISPFLRFAQYFGVQSLLYKIAIVLEKKLVGIYQFRNDSQGG